MTPSPPSPPQPPRPPANPDTTEPPDSIDAAARRPSDNWSTETSGRLTNYTTNRSDGDNGGANGGGTKEGGASDFSVTILRGQKVEGDDGDFSLKENIDNNSPLSPQSPISPSAMTAPPLLPSPMVFDPFQADIKLVRVKKEAEMGKEKGLDLDLNLEKIKDGEELGKDELQVEMVDGNGDTARDGDGAPENEKTPKPEGRIAERVNQANDKVELPPAPSTSSLSEGVMGVAVVPISSSSIPGEIEPNTKKRTSLGARTSISSSSRPSSSRSNTTAASFSLQSQSQSNRNSGYSLSSTTASYFPQLHRLASLSSSSQHTSETHESVATTCSALTTSSTATQDSTESSSSTISQAVSTDSVIATPFRTPAMSRTHSYQGSSRFSGGGGYHAYSNSSGAGLPYMNRNPSQQIPTTTSQGSPIGNGSAATSGGLLGVPNGSGVVGPSKPHSYSYSSSFNEEFIHSRAASAIGARVGPDGHHELEGLGVVNVSNPNFDYVFPSPTTTIDGGDEMLGGGGSEDVERVMVVDGHGRGQYPNIPMAQRVVIGGGGGGGGERGIGGSGYYAHVHRGSIASTETSGTLGSIGSSGSGQTAGPNNPFGHTRVNSGSSASGSAALHSSPQTPVQGAPSSLPAPSIRELSSSPSSNSIHLPPPPSKTVIMTAGGGSRSGSTNSMKGGVLVGGPPGGPGGGSGSGTNGNGSPGGAGEKKTQGQGPTQTQSQPQGQSQKALGKSAKDFEFGETLGEGSYSTVYQVKEIASPYRGYALKVLDKMHIYREKKIQYVHVEKNALNRLYRHPGVVRMFWTFHDVESLYFVLELAENGEILKWIKKYGSFDLRTTQFYAAQVLSALEWIHSKNIIHRDLKPENILMDTELRIKITDFGTAKLLSETSTTSRTENGEASQTTGKEEASERASSFVGTAEYVSPELLTEKTAYKSSDFWAFGCIIYQMLAGRPPFKGASEYLTFQKIINLDYSFPDGFPESAKSLIQKLLVLDPRKRLGGVENGGAAGGSSGAQTVKNNPFFDGVDWDTLWTRQVPEMKTGLVEPKKEKTWQEMNGDAFLDAQFAGLDEYHDDDGEFGDNDVPHHPNGGGENGVPPDGGYHENPRISNEKTKKPPDHQQQGVVLKDGSGSSSGSSVGRNAAKRQQNGTAFSAGSSQPQGGKWANVLLPSEMILYTAEVLDRNQIFSKKRQLVLTDFPRLLCLKESAKKVKIKGEVILGSAGPVPGTAIHPVLTNKSAGSKGRENLRLSSSPEASGIGKGANSLLRIEMDGNKIFTVETPSRNYRFEDPNACADRWLAEIRQAHAGASS